MNDFHCSAMILDTCNDLWMVLMSLMIFHNFGSKLRWSGGLESLGCLEPTSKRWMHATSEMFCFEVDNIPVENLFTPSCAPSGPKFCRWMYNILCEHNVWFLWQISVLRNISMETFPAILISSLMPTGVKMVG